MVYLCGRPSKMAKPSKQATNTFRGPSTPIGYADRKCIYCNVKVHYADMCLCSDCEKIHYPNYTRSLII